MESKLASALEEKQLVIDCPHTVLTVVKVLDFNLTQELEQQTKAGLTCKQGFQEYTRYCLQSRT